MIELQDGLWRGPRPADFEELKSKKIRTVISLQSGWWEFFHRRMYNEDQLAQKADILEIHLPVSGIGLPPTRPQVDQFFWAIERRRDHGGIYFHCLHGVDRTGFMAAAWRVLQQRWSVEQAIREWKDAGFHTWSYWYWIPIFKWQMKRMAPWAQS